MKELLERVAKCMPEGFFLEPAPLGYNLLTNKHKAHCDGELFYLASMNLTEGFHDLVLAPLTALLKQGLPGIKTERLAYEAGPRSGLLYWNAWCDGLKGGLHLDDVSFKDTEFEAVANAYLAIKENQCN